jgi:hypothetical protein
MTAGFFFRTLIPMKLRLFTPALVALNLTVPAMVLADVVLVASADAKPACSAVGTRSEGWYQNGELIRYAQCGECSAVCNAIGSRSEGWYGSCEGELIAYASCGQAAAHVPFTDVPTYRPDAVAIYNLQARGIVSGYADGTYRPDNSINRAEFVKILQGAYMSTIKDTVWEDGMCASIFLDETMSFPLKDVSKEAWYAHSVCTGFSQGWIEGYADRTFRPAQNINFAEAAKIVALAFPFPTPKPVAGTVWYKPYIDGLRLGKALPESYKSPDQLVTRGEMAIMINAALFLAEKPIPTDKPVVGEGCQLAGCSAQICQNADEEPMASDCMWRQEYACYEHATCEKQSDGECGWTQTDQLKACVNDAH